MSGCSSIPRNQVGFTLGHPYPRNEAGVKCQVIGFDAIAEDDAVIWHVRGNYQLFSWFNLPKDQRGLGSFGGKWLAHSKPELLRFPAQGDLFHFGWGVANGVK